MMAGNDGTTGQTPATLLTRLRDLREAVIGEADTTLTRWQPWLHRRAFCLGARNLAHYLAFRKRDLRDLQASLAMYGLSSLGRAESRVLANLDAVIATLAQMTGESSTSPHPRAMTFFRGDRLLATQTEALFGAATEGRRVRIMVTFPTEAATDSALVHSWVEAGMEIARLNCAHDDAEAWLAMIENVRAAEEATDRQVKILMDLGGPKIRTAEVLAPKKTRVQVGDAVLLTRAAPKKSKAYPFQAQVAEPAIFGQVQVGSALWIDDGQVSARVEEEVAEGLVVRADRTGTDGYKLKPEKGLNFPDTDLELPALTPDDLKALDFVAEHADMIGYSFVQSADDVALLQDELQKRIGERARQIAIIAKIETPRAVRNLPEIVVRAAGAQPFGVMIARGDLAVELGFERMAEMQEEILWLCEAAHVPVIWATQVLERFVKDGTLSRAEMTDAYMSARAECVMLNKGPFVADAIHILDDVLRRMEGHQTKKTPQLRALRAWMET